jgi:hypothetical protein
MTTSNTEPNTIIPDFGTIQHGTLDILVNWDITSAEKTNEMGDTYTEWTFESVRLNWILPQAYTTQSDIQAYLDANYTDGENILNWAKASKVNKV